MYMGCMCVCVCVYVCMCVCVWCVCVCVRMLVCTYLCTCFMLSLLVNHYGTVGNEGTISYFIPWQCPRFSTDSEYHTLSSSILQYGWEAACGIILYTAVASNCLAISSSGWAWLRYSSAMFYTCRRDWDKCHVHVTYRSSLQQFGNVEVLVGLVAVFICNRVLH